MNKILVLAVLTMGLSLTGCASYYHHHDGECSMHSNCSSCEHHCHKCEKCDHCDKDKGECPMEKAEAKDVSKDAPKK
jgi:hypothetical protein